MMSGSDLWVLGQGAAEYAEELDEAGRHQESKFVEAVSLLGLGMAIAALLKKLGDASERKGARRARAVAQRFATRAGDAYRMAWMQAAQYYGGELPEGWKVPEQWDMTQMLEDTRPSFHGQEPDVPASDG